MGENKIIVVDDDSDIRETISFALEQEGYRVICTDNGWDALGAVRATQPNLVILDVILPRENGYRVSGLIKDDSKKGVYQKDIPIILLTGRPMNDPDAMKVAIEFSQADYIMYKPFDMEQLVIKVKELLPYEREENNG